MEKSIIYNVNGIELQNQWGAGNPLPQIFIYYSKHVTGETASSIINRCLTNEIRNRLMDSDKPIQEIADELGFANQSFFGKYVKAHLGMTASQFRKSRCYR